MNKSKAPKCSDKEKNKNKVFSTDLDGQLVYFKNPRIYTQMLGGELKGWVEHKPPQKGYEYQGIILGATKLKQPTDVNRAIAGLIEIGFLPLYDVWDVISKTAQTKIKKKLADKYELEMVN